MNTLKIHPDLQERILRGEFGYVPEKLLRNCVRLESEEAQRRLLEEHATRVRPTRGSGPLPSPPRVGRHTVSLRLVVYFNPRMFVEQRASLSQRRQRAVGYVNNLNRKLRSPRSTMEKTSIRTDVHNALSRWGILSVYDIRIQSVREKESGRSHLKVRLRLNEEEWRRRIRYAGFVLLVAHPDLPHSGEDLVGLYRQKDMIEKDFQTIKDTVKLRPLYHHTDPKVRAHVTLCMLALLLERTIERRVKLAGMSKTAAACFEELEPCRLNLITSHPELAPAYVVTEATQEQLAILRNMRISSLVDREEIASAIHPRTNP